MKRQKQKPAKKIRMNATVAGLGFYTAPVQKAVSRWRGCLWDDEIEHLFFTAAMLYSHDGFWPDSGIPCDARWPLFWDLLQAAKEIYTDKTSPVYWLLKSGFSVAVNCRFDDWGTLALQIEKKWHGPAFQADALKQAAKRMKILTPPEIKEATPFFRAVTRHG
jgi:hypothetical protein